MQGNGTQAHLKCGPQKGEVVSAPAKVAQNATSMGPKPYRHSAGVCLLLLLSAQVMALDCNFLKRQQKRCNSQIVELLEAKTKFPLNCLEDFTTFHFPKKVLELTQPQLATQVVYEIFMGFFTILSSPELQTGWKSTDRERSVTVFSNVVVGRICHGKGEAVVEVKKTWLFSLCPRLLSTLHEPMEYIKRCSRAGFNMKSTDGWRNRLRLWKYFQRIKKFVKTKGLGACVWEKLRLEMRTAWIHVDELTKQMSS